MRHAIGVVCAGGVLALSLFGTVLAGPFEDGQAAYGREDYGVAIRLWRPLAEQGDARAQYMVGLAYGLGHGVPQSYAEAAKWYRRAADQGNSDAQTNLGALYAGGHAVPQDYAEAISWWRRAAAN